MLDYGIQMSLKLFLVVFHILTMQGAIWIGKTQVAHAIYLDQA